MPFSPIVSK
jgi:hypothetical protein